RKATWHSQRKGESGRTDHEAATVERWKKIVAIHGSALLRRALDRADDARIGAAATEIGTHMLDDLGAAGVRIALQEIGGAHDLAGLAVAALRYALGEPGL